VPEVYAPASAPWPAASEFAPGVPRRSRGKACHRLVAGAAWSLPFVPSLFRVVNSLKQRSRNLLVNRLGANRPANGPDPSSRASCAALSPAIRNG